MPKPVMSNGPRMLLEFRGRQSGRGNRGFKAEYKFLESKLKFSSKYTLFSYNNH